MNKAQNKFFTIVLSSLILLVFLSIGSCEPEILPKGDTPLYDYQLDCPSANSSGSGIGDAHPRFSGFKLVCSDEFNVSTIDTNLWKHDTQGNAGQWGNNEEQHYTGASDDNAYISSGALVIEAKHESMGGRSYTSARLHTHGSLSVRYGVIEARIKLPSGNSGNTDPGTWPAFWLLGDSFNGWGHTAYGGNTAWPQAGEIDIMESNLRATGYGKVSAALHYRNEKAGGHNYKSGDVSINNGNSAYHIYSVEWTDKKMVFYLDYVPYYTLVYEDIHEEFLESFFILLNVAVGGNFPGTPNPANYPQKMYVDWVRIYQ